MDDQPLSGKRVLVVEDEMLVLMSIEDMLGDLGCTSVMVAGNVETALTLIATNDFDLATLDINLAGTLSYKIAEALADHSIPFAFSTGYGEHGVDQGFGDRPVLNKPFSHFVFSKVVIGLVSKGVPPSLAA